VLEAIREERHSAPGRLAVFGRITASAVVKASWANGS
jgi:hypothetical protein